MIRRMSVLVFLLTFVLSASSAFGGDRDVYLYDDAVAGDVDVGRFVSTGEVRFLQGTSKFSDTGDGPAPEPYPQIHVWEHGYEQLGRSNVEIDGIWFLTWGRYWQKDRHVFVLWKIRVTNADQRMASEFDPDLTLSLWVDWDENEMWDKDELENRRHLNIGHLFPTNWPTRRVYYLTVIRVPDVTERTPSGWWNDGWWKKEIRHYWVRGLLSCDDPDVSPDGEQLFGEAEDYRINYLVKKEKPHDEDDDDDDSPALRH